MYIAVHKIILVTQYDKMILHIKLFIFRQIVADRKIIFLLALCAQENIIRTF